MALETATYISDLNAANPAATDGLAQADDHFRIIKGAVKATFPNVTGAISATHGALDAAATFAGAITASAAEINVLAGISAKINVLAGISAGLTSAELSVLDGVTATTSQINATALIASPLVVGPLAEGSILVGDVNTVASPVTIGAAGTVLKSDGTTISWGAVSAGTPTGAVIYHAANTPPSGYIKADGLAVSRSTYATLFSVIGTTYGVGDGSSTFNVPDLRGEFIRGWDDSRGIDSGRSFGSAQADELKSHSHSIPMFRDNFYGTRPLGGGMNNLADTSTSAFGGTETRPRNVSLLACIKY